MHETITFRRLDSVLSDLHDQASPFDEPDFMGELFADQIDFAEEAVTNHDELMPEYTETYDTNAVHEMYSTGPQTTAGYVDYVSTSEAAVRVTKKYSREEISKNRRKVLTAMGGLVLSAAMALQGAMHLKGNTEVVREAATVESQVDAPVSAITTPTTAPYVEITTTTTTEPAPVVITTTTTARPKPTTPKTTPAPQIVVSYDGDTVWDKLAWCESTGNWAANTGNGYYGGVQFSKSSWKAVGGEGLPSDASREEQIMRAEKLLAVQGWGAWPACSKKLGLR